MAKKTPPRLTEYLTAWIHQNPASDNVFIIRYWNASTMGMSEIYWRKNKATFSWFHTGLLVKEFSLSTFFDII